MLVMLSCANDVELLMLELDKPVDELAGSSTTYEDLKFIERVIEVTGCRDRRLVSEICAEAGYFDLDLVCSHVLAFMEGVRSSSSSTTSDTEQSVDVVCNSTLAAATSSVTSSAAAATGAKPKSRKTRRQRKQEKKARASQRHRANAMSNTVATDAGGCHGRLGSSDEDDSAPFVITQQLKVLQI